MNTLLAYADKLARQGDKALREHKYAQARALYRDANVLTEFAFGVDDGNWEDFKAIEVALSDEWREYGEQT